MGIVKNKKTQGTQENKGIQESTGNTRKTIRKHRETQEHTGKYRKQMVERSTGTHRNTKEHIGQHMER